MRGTGLSLQNLSGGVPVLVLDLEGGHLVADFKHCLAVLAGVGCLICHISMCFFAEREYGTEGHLEVLE